MADLQVIYDPNLEIGAIIDLDTNLGWGPMCPGPTGGELLQAFVDGMPFDLAILTPEQARDIFLSVFRNDATAAIEAKTTGDSPPMVESGDTTAVDTALATAEAVASAGAPPDPQPADTDMAADTSQTDTVTVDPTVAPSNLPDAAATVAPSNADTVQANCLICNPQGTGSNNPACPVCGGTGHVPKAQ